MAGLFFYLSPLLLAALQLTSLQFSVGVEGLVGVSLKVQGVAVPNNSIVDFHDLLYRTAYPDELEGPSNANPTLHDEALLCVTDLVDCCESSRTVRGDWYYPDGRTVHLESPWNIAFGRNRGQNEIRNGRQFYGSVRLWRRWTPTERGRFRCELPSAADPDVNQTLYANILNFGVDPVAISPSTGSTATTAGERDYSLNCSATLFDSIPLPDDVPSPNFQWSFNGSASLPSGVTAMPTVMSSFDETSNETRETYSSILQFSLLSQSLHTGMYICRLGVGRLVNSAVITVNAPPISVMVTANLNTPLMVGQTGNTLTCDVSGADNLNPMITYLWTRNGETVSDASLSSLSLSPFRLSHAGNYTCRASISSPLLNDDIIATSDVNITIPRVFFSSKGSYVNPNGNIVITDIGEGDCKALLCYTDHMECCQDGNTTVGEGTLGQWFYPNGSVVGTRRDRQEFYVDRGPSVVRLNRRSNATLTTGRFCCVVPDVTSTRTTICVNVHVAAQFPSKQAITCTREATIGAAVAVGATIITECLFIGAPITLVLLRILRQKRRLAARDLNEKESSNKEGAASNAAQGCRMREVVYVEPNHDKTATAKPVMQDEEPYEVVDFNNSTMLQCDSIDDDNIYVVPDNTMMATTMRGRGAGEDAPYSTVNTMAAVGIITMWSGEREGESAVYEDPDNPGVDTYTSLRERSEVN